VGYSDRAWIGGFYFTLYISFAFRPSFAPATERSKIQPFEACMAFMGWVQKGDGWKEESWGVGVIMSITSAARHGMECMALLSHSIGMTARSGYRRLGLFVSASG
jgi:hypothetical protein